MARRGWAAEEGCGDGCCGPSIGDLNLFGDGTISVGTGGVSVGGSAGATANVGGPTSAPTPMTTTPAGAAFYPTADILAQVSRAVVTTVGTPVRMDRSQLRSLSIRSGPAIQPLAVAVASAPASSGKKKAAIAAGAGLLGVIALWGMTR